MKRGASDDQRTGYADTSLQRLSWSNIRDVFKILKEKGLLGPLSNAALTIAYSNLKRSYQQGGSDAFRQSWTKEQWWDFFRNTFYEETSNKAREAFEKDEFDGVIDWGGDPQDQGVWDEAYENFTDTYSLEIMDSWMSFPPNANYFHVFIAFFIRFVAPGDVIMTRDGYYMHIKFNDAYISQYQTYNGDPSNVENMTDSQGPRIFDEKILYWNENLGSDLTVKFIYEALQDGWRFTGAKTLMELAPESVKSQIGNCHNCQRVEAQVQCGHKCKKAFYCGQKCADIHYELHKLDCKKK